MKIKRYKSLKEATTTLMSEGYVHSFELTKAGLQCLKNKKIYPAEEVKIVEHHRFEGIDSTDDTVLLFVMELEDGTKGLNISTYGAYYDLDLIGFIDKVKIIPRKN